MDIVQSGTKTIAQKSGKNFSAVNVGKFEDLESYGVLHPRTGKTKKGKLFLREQLALTGMQISLNKMPAGQAVPFYHKHKENEELYIFIKGKGQMQIDGEVIDVTEGSVVKIATDGIRTWRNIGGEDLYCIVIQAKQNSLKQDTFDDGVADETPVTWPN